MDDRKELLRALSNLHPKLRKEGFSYPLDETEAASAALLFKNCLINQKDPHRPITAARLAHRLYDASESHCPATGRRACKSGCDYCCHTFVSVTAPEIFFIAHGMGVDEIDEFKRLSLPLKGLDSDARFDGERLACPLLRDRLCRLHAARPLKCRQHNSMAVEPCIAAFNGAEDKLPLIHPLMLFGITCETALRAGLRASGFSTSAYELSEGVTTALETQDALPRWIAGEDIFAGVQKDEGTATHVEKWIEDVAASLG